MLVACCVLPFCHAQEANQAKSIRDGNPEQTEQTSKSVCLPAVAANCSLRLATQCQFQRFQCEVESKQPDTRLAQYLRHKSTVSLPPNLTECSLNHFMPALRLLKPHVKKKQHQPKLMSPRVLHTLNFEECQFFHPDPKTPSQKHYKISCSRNANLNFLFSVESIKHLVMTILPTK